MYEKHDANHKSNVTFPLSPLDRNDASEQFWIETGIFDGIANWPDLDQHFHNDGLKLLQSEGGITAWQDAGGCIGEDGRWTFGYQSNRGREIFRELLRSSPGFLWTTTCGHTWAVLPNGEDRANTSRAYGVSHPNAVQALDLIAQVTARQTLEARLLQLRDGEKPWTLEDHGEFVRQSQTLHRLHAIEDAVRLLPYLRYRVRWDDSSSLTATADEVAMWLPADTEEFNTDSLGKALEAASQITLAKIRIGQLALGLKVVDRTAAITRFTRRRDEYRVEVSPLLIEVLDAFASVGCEEDLQ